jgi:hypothetical protein
VVAALLRWRQLDYQAARQQTLWGGVMDVLRDTAGFRGELGPQLARHLGLGLAHTLTARPDSVVGVPRPPVGRGTELPLDGDVQLVTRGLGMELAVGDPGEMLDAVRTLAVPIVRFSDLPAREVGALTQLTLQSTLSQAVTYLATDAMAGLLETEPLFGPTIPRTTLADGADGSAGAGSAGGVRDVLDELLEHGPPPPDQRVDDNDDDGRWHR